MPKLAANLSMLFTELPFLDRFEAAANAGFNAVECQFPYAYPIGQIQLRLEQYKLKLVMHNLPAGDREAGSRGIACLPDRTSEFREGVFQAIEYAKRLGVRQLNCLAGRKPPSLRPEVARQTLIENLRFAAKELKQHDIWVLIEPINTIDSPGFFVNRTQQALDILDEVDIDNAFLQYDIYHAQRMEGEIATTITSNFSRIAHIQVADNPGRHEPGTGEINYRWLFSYLDAIGYVGWVGCEYKPATTTLSGLNWREALGVQIHEIDY